MTNWEADVARREGPTARWLKTTAAAQGEALAVASDYFWSLLGAGPGVPDPILDRLCWSFDRLADARDDLVTLQQPRKVVASRGGYAWAAGAVFASVDAVYMVFQAVHELAGPWPDEAERIRFAVHLNLLGKIRETAYEMACLADGACFPSRGY